MAKLSINSEMTMNSGYKIPVLGYGVYQTPADVTEDVTLHAFKTGYRHASLGLESISIVSPLTSCQVDSARAYRNEAPCAEAIRKSGLKRSDIFFTSKVPPKSLGYEETQKAIDATFKETGIDYVDLYLIHAPYGGREGRLGAWRALVEAQKAGKIRSLGVSNYGVHHLDELEAYIKELESKDGKGAGGTIDVGQWELHPWLARPDIVAWCQKRNVVLEAYCPVVRGKRFEEPVVQKLAKAHGKTPAQILLRWSLRMGFVPLPKSVTKTRIEENADLYGFELSKEEMEELTTSEYAPCAWDPTTSKD